MSSLNLNPIRVQTQREYVKDISDSSEEKMSPPRPHLPRSESPSTLPSFSKGIPKLPSTPVSFADLPSTLSRKTARRYLPNAEVSYIISSDTSPSLSTQPITFPRDKCTTASLCFSRYLVYCSFQELIHYMTQPTTEHREVLEFILVYRSFCESTTLMKAIINRYPTHYI